MPKKLLVEVSDETSQQLSELAASFGLSINQAVDEILKMVACNSAHVERLSQIIGANKNLGFALYVALHNYPTIAEFFNDVLSKVKAEGKFEIDIANVEFNLATGYFRFRFDSIPSDYLIGSLEIMKDDEDFNVSTYTSVKIEETANNSFEDLKAVAESMDNPFDVDDCRIHIDDYGDDFCDLVIDCFDESMEYLPTAKELDAVTRKILKKSKVKLKK
jgi:hypothetical protein